MLKPVRYSSTLHPSIWTLSNCLCYFLRIYAITTCPNAPAPYIAAMAIIMPWVLVDPNINSRKGIPNVFPRLPACAMMPFERTWVWAVVLSWGTAAKVALWMMPIIAKRVIQTVAVGRAVKDSKVVRVASAKPVVTNDIAEKRANRTGIKISAEAILINGRMPIRDVDCPAGNVSGMIANRATKVAV